MIELYLLTRLNALLTVFSFMIAIPIITAIINLFFATLEYDDPVIGWNKCRIASFIIGVLGVVFVPSKSDMLLIYGVGSTIDYIQSNETINQLPDKCVDALNEWVESINDNE